MQRVKFSSGFENSILDRILKDKGEEWNDELTKLAKEEIFSPDWDDIYLTGDTEKATRSKREGKFFTLAAPGIDYANKIYYGVDQHVGKGPRPWLKNAALKFIDKLKNDF